MIIRELENNQTAENLRMHLIFPEAFQAASSGWVDNRCPFVDSVNQGWAIFKPVERGSHVLGICCICNQTDISPKHLFTSIFVTATEMHFYFISSRFIYISPTPLLTWCADTPWYHLKPSFKCFLSPNCQWYILLHFVRKASVQFCYSSHRHI